MATTTTLRAALDEVASFVRATESFNSLINGAADGISKQAQERKSLVSTLKNVKVASAIEDVVGQVQVAALSARIEREAAAQMKFADWLRKLAGERGGDDA